MSSVHRIALGILLFVLAGCAAGVATDPPDRTTGSSGSAVLATARAGSSTVERTGSADPHAAATVAHVESILAQTPHFPGAVTLTAPPTAEFTDPPQTTPPTFVRRTGWWTSSLAPDQFPHWLQAHLPTAWTLEGGNPESHDQWGPHVLLDQYSAGPRSDAVWTYSAVNVFWGPFGSGTAVRVSAQADWVATRSGSESIGDDATTVDVRVLVPSGTVFTTATLPPTVHRTIHGSAAAALRETVNALNPWTDTGLHGCLATLGMTDVLTFRGGGRTITITTHDGGCTGTDFVVDHRTMPPLEDSVLHPQLVQVLGLPESYLTDW